MPILIHQGITSQEQKAYTSANPGEYQSRLSALRYHPVLVAAGGQAGNG